MSQSSVRVIIDVELPREDVSSLKETTKETLGLLVRQMLAAVEGATLVACTVKVDDGWEHSARASCAVVETR